MKWIQRLPAKKTLTMEPGSPENLFAPISRVGMTLTYDPPRNSDGVGMDVNRTQLQAQSRLLLEVEIGHTGHADATASTHLGSSHRHNAHQVMLPDQNSTMPGNTQHSVE